MKGIIDLAHPSHRSQAGLVSIYIYRNLSSCPRSGRTQVQLLSTYCNRPKNSLFHLIVSGSLAQLLLSQFIDRLIEVRLYSLASRQGKRTFHLIQYLLWLLGRSFFQT